MGHPHPLPRAARWLAAEADDEAKRGAGAVGRCAVFAEPDVVHVRTQGEVGKDLQVHTATHAICERGGGAGDAAGVASIRSPSWQYRQVEAT